ncbi:CHASE2 domain-containing protein [Crocosphaera sp.]|uniref:CHASE2 domain-containing protein n=1 Tax=Crocosphaera sp. TaxID=2729996 RepID=UPI002626B7F5|nr:CHASE2 domain-containing protein [Crocosphaera sp.]MDJ0580015.1 CHASE2 domain-containing protein [Crocosphaera sp.]
MKIKFPQWLSDKISIPLFLSSIIVTGLIFGIRYGSLLQSSELWALDQFFRFRAFILPEKPDPRLLIITIDQEDINYQQSLGWKLNGSLSDQALLQVLQKLNQYEVQTIGIDIYRDIKIENKQLLNLFQEQQNLYMVCRVGFPNANFLGIRPPESLKSEQIGFSDLVADESDIIRRQLINMTPPLPSLCQAKYSFNFLVFAHYISSLNQGSLYNISFDTIGVNITEYKTNAPANSLPKTVVFKYISSHSSGYQGVDAGGRQILLNYRALKSPEEIAFKIPLRSLLKGEIKGEIFKNRLVLIGTTVPDQDELKTPYNDRSQLMTYGVFVQAQMISQMLSAVLDNRPLLWFWSGLLEFIWIWFWSAIPSFFTGKKWQLFSIFGSACLLTAVNFFLFIYGGWIPLIPVLLSLMVMSINSLIYHQFSSKHSALSNQSSAIR